MCRKNKLGFTLVEMMMAIALFAVLISIAYPMFFTASRSFNTSVNKTFSQKQARFLADSIIKELRFVKDISVAPFNADSGDYFSLSTNNGCLVKTTYHEGAAAQSEIISLSQENNVPDYFILKSLLFSKDTFNPNIKNMLNVKIKVGNKSVCELDISIRLENIADLADFSAKSIIYYK